MERATLLQRQTPSVRGSQPAVVARPEGWELRLHQTLVRYSEAPFEWGSQDCFTLCTDVVKAMLQEQRGEWREYTSAKDALQILKEQGFRDIGEAFASVFEEIPPAFAQRGDIGRADYPGAKFGGGVVFIGHEVVCKAEQGLVRLPVSAVQRAFRVI